MTDQAWILIAVLVVVLVVVGAVALTTGRRRRGPTTLPPEDVSPYEVDQPPAAGASAPVVTAPEEPAPPETPAPTLERPEPVAGRMQRLRARLARSGTIGQTLLSILSRGDLAENDWEEIEETLLLADVGVGPTTELMDKLRTETKVLGTSDAEQVRAVLRRELLELVDPTMDRVLHVEPAIGDDGQPHPATVLVVGVNGTGKTTTVGKLARLLVAEDHDVVLGAADTFRAAAADQLSTWGARVGVPVVRSEREGADPAAVAFDAVKEGRGAGADVVLVDTAGRLQNKAGLMDELGKIKRVMSRQAPVREVLLVLDATTGQNGMRQAEVFSQAVDITGIVLTKLDGTAKGGIVVAVQRELGVPVKFVGLGEGPDDLAPFEPEEFVDALLS
ncbi:signal recognition particle-docking protein FtsY [Georgenia ruanii]|uniref:Signal recognition particle receptor FtsY n=1 Tax=Georgenia ruanii TaxID=348442 RepID=A0A7J9UR98_9MICO|nr:signal recognition particle-docking protein FtsY [Georgenia ruanii]MPV87141.1 signal recognition particle-docking protein FtsY [Georgenia ruanii]